MKPETQIFISYASEDREIAEKLYDDLKQAGVTPWMAYKNIFSGQKWKLKINEAIKNSSYFLALLSSNSLTKKGFVHKELKKALDLFDQLPPSDIFIIPVRINDCEPVDERLKELHWVDIFSSYEKGVDQILRVLGISRKKTGQDKSSGQREEEISKKQKAIFLLAEELNKKNLVVYFGACCSTSAGLLSWKEFVKGLKQEYNIETKHTDFVSLVSVLERNIGTFEFREKISEAFRTRPDINTPLHDIMVSSGINLFITTNHDHLLEDSFRKQGYSPLVITDDEDIPFIDPDRKTIVKLHGDIDSPTSLITAKDFTGFRMRRQGFVKWLKTVASQNTILFFGTSLEDPWIKKTDEHVLDIFNEFERHFYIILKKPQNDSMPDEDYEIELEDFEVLCELYIQRGFFVIQIEQYSEINTILQKIRSKALNRKIESDPSDIKAKLILQTDYSNTLEKNIQNLLDEKTRKLCEDIAGKDRVPTPAVMIENTEKLIKHLENPPGPLSSESQMQGFLTVADAILASNKREHITTSRQYYEKANKVFHNISDQKTWKEKMLRVRAKLLFFEGKNDEATESLSDSENNKTISIWLALLIDSNRFNEAYSFISKCKIDPTWACEALYILIHNGNVQKAESLFKKTVKEYESFKKKGKLDDSPYMGKIFYDRICYVMAYTLLQRAYRLTGKSKLTKVFPGDLTKEGETLCRKALSFVKMLFKQASRKDLGENYYAYQAVTVELNATRLLKKWEQSDKVAEELALVKPVDKNVVLHIYSRGDQYDKSFLKKMIHSLSEDYPEDIWAILIIARLELYFFQNNKNSWKTLQKAVNLAVTLDDKIKVSQVCFETGFLTSQLDEALAIINEILPTDNVWKMLFEARYEYLNNNPESAEKIFTVIENSNPYPEVSAEIELVRADYAIKQEKWEDARKYLEHSKNLVLKPTTLMKLLQVLVELQDTIEALKISEQIEAFGVDDPGVIHIKAQSASILGQFEKSEQAWQSLVKRFNQEPGYAMGLANVLILRDKYQKALETLEPFIRCDENTHVGCLASACRIYEIKEDYDKAFGLLDKCHKYYENEPSLLVQHMELGYRTGRQDEANESFLRLEVLRQEGKISEEEIAKVPLDKALEMFRTRQESFKKINDMYRLGQIPRMLLCKAQNMPLYLDWAVRTQELILPSDTEEWIAYTIYSTNGLRLEFIKESNRLVLIHAPFDTDEIVIDFHALLTVHRLGLLEKLKKRYRNIYYPHILKIVLETDQKRFGHHQLSQEKVYRKLNERLLTGQILEIVSPDSHDDSTRQHDSFLKRNLRLARLEKIPFIDAYSEKEDFDDFQDVDVFKLSQAVQWLYSKGRLSEKQFRRISELSKGLSEIIKDGIQAKLETSFRFLIDLSTLEIMEEYDLVQIILDTGTQIAVERASANYIRYTVLGLDFGQKVGSWNRDLVKYLRNSKFLNAVQPAPNKSVLYTDPYYEAAISSINYAEENGKVLFTDDRCTQMLRTQKKQFGSDALITHLFEKEIISLEEYANYFLSLCKWRYRFLIPDARIMVFFAKEYKNSPLGKPLNTIADYGRKCMEDPGLFLGIEPPTLFGVKFYRMWIAKWTEFLISIWLDDDFTNHNCKLITQKVYHQAIPDVPININSEIRRDYYDIVFEKEIIMEIFIQATLSDSPLRLNGLLENTFERFGYDDRRKEAELNSHFDFLRSNPENFDRKILKAFVIRTLKVFLGERIHDDPIVIPSAHPVLIDTGLIDKDRLLNPDEIKNDNLSSNYTPDDLLNYISNPVKLPEYIPKGPLIIVPPSEEKHGTILEPHALIKAVSKNLRIEAIKNILKNDYISHYTKQLVEKKSKEIQSGDLSVWHPAANEMSYIISKDFYYALSFFGQALKVYPPDNELISEAWKYVMTPDTESVLSEMPLLIDGALDEEPLKQRIEKKSIEKGLSEEEPMQSLLNWYLKNIYFIPVALPLNPWQIITHTFPFYEKKTNNRMEGVTSLDILHTVKKWIKEKEDPFAFLMAIELVLNARARAKENEKPDFTNGAFYEFLDSLFEVVLYERKEDVSKENMSIFAIWTMRVHLTRYYVKYIDLNIKQDIEDEKKIALAWWMGRELSSSIAESCNHLKEQDRIAWIQKLIEKQIKDQDEKINFTHLIVYQTNCISPFRYHTLQGENLLASATLSMIMPGKTRDNAVFTGISQPATALSPETRDNIINKLLLHTLRGEGQLPKENNSRLPLLWNISPCTSGPAFLKEYYGDAIDLLGRDKVMAIKFAEDVSQPDPLAELNKIPQYLTEIPRYANEREGLLPITVILGALKVYVLTHEEIPENAAVLFKENIMLAKELSRLKDEWAFHCLLHIIQILDKSHTSGTSDWTETIGELFKNIDYGLCTEHTIKMVLSALIAVVLRGCDYSLLKPFLNVKASDARVRNTLIHIKVILEYVFPRVPGIYRENVRKLLNDLDDIPLPEK